MKFPGILFVAISHKDQGLVEFLFLDFHLLFDIIDLSIANPGDSIGFCTLNKRDSSTNSLIKYNFLILYLLRNCKC